MDLSQRYFNNQKLNNFLLFSPLLVLLITRAGIELVTTRLLEARVSWIPAFLAYYASIVIVFLIIRYVFHVPLLRHLEFSIRPVPNVRLLLATVVVPAVLPLPAFITQSSVVPGVYFLYILIFSVVNASFEEFYWRGILAFLPGRSGFRILFTAALFSFSHFLFWDHWYRSHIIMIPTVVSTFIMGLLWMHFINSRKNILYPIISHVMVDIFNLSVAVYSGLIKPPSF